MINSLAVVLMCLWCTCVQSNPVPEPQPTFLSGGLYVGAVNPLTYAYGHNSPYSYNSYNGYDSYGGYGGYGGYGYDYGHNHAYHRKYRIAHFHPPIAVLAG